MGKPVIATDVPGCRDAVDAEVTGLLCAARSAESLASAMLRMARLADAERRAMGRSGGSKMEQEFCESGVVELYLQALDAS